MNPTEAPDRCRIVLIAPPREEPKRILSAFEGGDVASLILPQWEADDDEFQSYAEAIIPGAQAAGLAVMIAGDPRIAARCRADGIHFEGSKQALAEIVEKHQAKLMVGTGGATTRDDALELGEVQPDYMFFGKFGYDNKPEPHPRNLKLGEWWGEMVRIPCIVMAGSDLAGLAAVAETGVDFVALSAAVFGDGIDPAQAVARANELLDQAPRFDEG
ncbi:thiamine phosphate synthase [Mesorhizobium sp. CAU 1741]|uniref:thiamine phosphate synthase n=1 Tax=Mesorhizobium sp. CAU 1741 TaxID=3140366 RepID=UPI00325AFC62